jgi:hypothetical protein
MVILVCRFSLKMKNIKTPGELDRMNQERLECRGDLFHVTFHHVATSWHSIMYFNNIIMSHASIDGAT